MVKTCSKIICLNVLYKERMEKRTSFPIRSFAFLTRLGCPLEREV
ncbi:hypothetical protein [Ureibacillus sp. FSL K6-0786]